MLRLTVTRDFTGVKTATDPKWLAQLVQRVEVRHEGVEKKGAEVVVKRWGWDLDGFKEAWKGARRACERVMHLGTGKSVRWRVGFVLTEEHFYNLSVFDLPVCHLRFLTLPSLFLDIRVT